MKPGIDTGILRFMIDDDCEWPDIFTDDERDEPQSSLDDIPSIGGNYIDEVFGPSGFLAQKFAGYEPRAPQLEVVRAIDDALTKEKNLLAEAGTGTGKSVAYLVPAIRHSLESGASRVLVVTANNALSEQLIKKDLPTLRDVLPWQFEFAMAKGRANFLCRSAYDHVDRTLFRVLPSSREQIDRIDEWAAETTTGDLSELSFEPSPEVKRRLTMTSDECMGRKCDRFDDCFVETAKKRLETAKVVVTNYHLYLVLFNLGPQCSTLAIGRRRLRS